MNGIETILAVAAVLALTALPFHLTLRWAFGRSDDQRHTSLCGIALDWEELDAVDSTIIGRYRGRSIPASIEFHGLRFRFDRVAPSSYRQHVVEGELFLDPGLVYVADAPH